MDAFVLFMPWNEFVVVVALVAVTDAPDVGAGASKKSKTSLLLLLLLL